MWRILTTQLAGPEILRAGIRKSVFTRQRTAQEGYAAAAQKAWPICLDGLTDQQAWPSSLAATTHTPERGTDGDKLSTMHTTLIKMK